MSDLNALYLQGRLTKDATMSTLSNGASVVQLSMAVNKDYLDKQTNEWKKQTNFFDVSCWSESAKRNLSEYTKGREILIEAELKTSTWEKDGKKYSRTEIRASRIRALRRPGEGRKASGNETAQASVAEPPAPEFENNDEILF